MVTQSYLLHYGTADIQWNLTKKKKSWNYLTTVLKYAIIPEIMSAPYLEHTDFGLPTEILILGGGYSIQQSPAIS